MNEYASPPRSWDTQTPKERVLFVIERNSFDDTDAWISEPYPNEWSK